METCSICGKDIDKDNVFYMGKTAEGKLFFPICHSCNREVPESRGEKYVSEFSKESYNEFSEESYNELPNESYNAGYKAGYDESINQGLGCIGWGIFFIFVVPIAYKISFSISSFFGPFAWLFAIVIFFGIIFGVFKLIDNMRNKM